MKVENESSVVAIPHEVEKKSKPSNINGDRKAKLSSCSVVPIASGKEVPQSDLIAERIAFQKALRAYEEWQKKHQAIRSAIERGCPVEEGIYKAEIIEQSVENHLTGFPVKITKLMVW
jgi:hypothetical protein